MHPLKAWTDQRQPVHWIQFLRGSGEQDFPIFAENTIAINSKVVKLSQRGKHAQTIARNGMFRGKLTQQHWNLPSEPFPGQHSWKVRQNRLPKRLTGTFQNQVRLARGGTLHRLQQTAWTNLGKQEEVHMIRHHYECAQIVMPEYGPVVERVEDDAGNSRLA